MVATLLAAQVAGLLLLYWLLARRIRRATDVTAHVAALRAEVGGLVAELNGTTDRNVRLLEDRVSSVNEIVENLDRKLRVLRREGAKAVAPVVVSALPTPAAAGPLPGTQAVASSLSIPLTTTSTAGSVAPIGEHPPAKKNNARAGSDWLDGSSAGEEGRAVPGGELQVGHIARLHRSGLSPANIAHRLGIDVGEVELVIALRARDR